MSTGVHDRPNRATLVMLSMAALFALGVVVATLTLLVRCEEVSNEGRKVTPANSRAVQELVAAQHAELGEEPGWVNKKAGILSIPVEQAMHVVVDEIRRDPGRATPPPSASSSGASTVPPPAALSSTQHAG